MGIQLLRSPRVTRLIAVWCAVLGSAAVPGGFAAASQISGLTVSLVPINSGTSFVNGTFTVPIGGNTSVTPFTLSVRMSGVVPAAFNVSQFSSELSWSASAGAVAANLFTATSAGVPSIVPEQTLLANSPGMLFRDSYYDEDNELFLPPFREMNQNVDDPVSEIYWAVGISYAAPVTAVIPISGSFVDKEIARIRMGLAANVASGSFTLQLTGQDPYGFYDQGSGNFYSVVTPSTTLTVVPVPEPATLAVLLPGLVVLGGVGLRRRMSRRTGSYGTRSDSCLA